MKKIYIKAKPQRSFRRLINQWLASLLKSQNTECRNNFESIMEKLREIEDSIEIVAREIYRQTGRRG